MQDHHSHTGLRQRKKAATQMAIEWAAVEIAFEQGYEAATAEAIAAKANVSLRTFFNYFPTKDTAIVGRGVPFIDDEWACQILAECGDNLLGGIARVAEECLTEMDPTSELMRRRRHIIRDRPQLNHLFMAAMDRFEDRQTQLVARHLRAHPSQRHLGPAVAVEEEARLAVIVVSSAVRYHMQQAVDKDMDLNLLTLDIEETIDMMAAIHSGGKS